MGFLVLSTGLLLIASFSFWLQPVFAVGLEHNIYCFNFLITNSSFYYSQIESHFAWLGDHRSATDLSILVAFINRVGKSHSCSNTQDFRICRLRTIRIILSAPDIANFLTTFLILLQAYLLQPQWAHGLRRLDLRKADYSMFVEKWPQVKVLLLTTLAFLEQNSSSI